MSKYRGVQKIDRLGQGEIVQFREEQRSSSQSKKRAWSEPGATKSEEWCRFVFQTSQSQTQPMARQCFALRRE
jgi:hypothetical protein